MKVSVRKRRRGAVNRRAVRHGHPGTAKGGIRDLKGRRHSSGSRTCADALSGMAEVAGPIAGRAE
jgi:hypothetical protein